MAEGGNVALMKGVVPSVMKAILLNVSLTGPYDYLNEKMWITFGDVNVNRPAAMAFAAGVASLVTLPFDNVKVRL